MIYLRPRLWRTTTHDTWRFVRLRARSGWHGQSLWVRVRRFGFVWVRDGTPFWDWKDNFVER